MKKITLLVLITIVVLSIVVPSFATNNDGTITLLHLDPNADYYKISMYEGDQLIKVMYPELSANGEVEVTGLVVGTQYRFECRGYDESGHNYITIMIKATAR